MNYAKLTLITGIIIGSWLWGVNQPNRELSYQANWLVSNAYADEADEYSKLQEEKEEKLEEKQKLEEEATETAQEKESHQEQLDYYKGELVTTELSIDEKERLLYSLEERRILREEEYQRKLVEKNSLMRDLYINSAVTPLELVFGSESYSSFAQAWYYYNTLVKDGKRQILELGQILAELDAEKAREAALREQLVATAGVLSTQTVYYDGQVQQTTERLSSLNEDITVLEDEIAQITAKQSEIIAAKQASLNLPQSLGAGPLYCTDDRELAPGFSPAYAFFTAGIPHRVGMSQYGALGRAEAGQNAAEILDAYYADFELEQDYNTDIKIKVEGHGEYSLEDYVKRIYEMPASWPLEALKAQAVAARSYALAYTNNGEGSICDSQSCQVFKEEEKGGAWNEAVEATAGWVMTQGGSPIKSWYSSTAGGFTYQSNDVWGGSRRPWTKRVQDGSSSYGSFSDLRDKAYDRDSPCLYAAQGWRSDYGKSAWLKGEEVADIANVIRLARFTDVDKNHLYQVDKDNPEGVETYSYEKVREELADRGVTPFNGINSIEVVGVDWDYGSTTSLRINGESFDGAEFKNWFNLRAPANIQIVGPLYNVERK